MAGHQGHDAFSYGNGIVHTMTQNLRQLPDISRDVYGSTKYLDIDLGFDANGNVASSVDLAPSGHSRTMSYDDLDRLTGVGNTQLWTGASYSYDPLDNLRTAQLVKTTGTDTLTYSYHATTNRLTQVARAGQAAWTYGHDTRGNVTGDGRNNYTWTRANRLAAATGKESYQYDGHGRRVVMWRSDGTASVPMYGLDGKLRLTADNGLGGATYHVYLGDDNVADVFARWSDGQQTATYLHTDALGSPVVRTNQARAVTGRTVYAPYGEAVSTTGSTPANRIDYTGHAKDGATGLVYMQQRYYDPVVGRFISADPVATDPSMGAMFNRYNYANNNPYRFTDPDGRAACLPGNRLGLPGATGSCALPPQAPWGRSSPDNDLGNRSGNGRTKNDWNADGLSENQKVRLADIVAKDEKISTDGVTFAIGKKGTTRSYAMVNGEIGLSYAAFKTRSELAATLGHEIEVHYLRQIVPNKYRLPATTKEEAKWEIEAYQYNIDNSVRFENTPAEIENFHQRLKDYEQLAK